MTGCRTQGVSGDFISMTASGPTAVIGPAAKWELPLLALIECQDAGMARTREPLPNTVHSQSGQANRLPHPVGHNSLVRRSLSLMLRTTVG